MRKIRFPKIFPKSKSTEILDGLEQLNSDKKQLISTIRSYRVADNLKPLDFTKKHDENGFVKYLGLFIKNHTSIDLHKIGVTILEVKSTEETIFEEHMHDKQAQLIRVIKGKISDLKNNLIFNANESYLIPKRQEHLIRYYRNTRAIVIYMPNLKAGI